MQTGELGIRHGTGQLAGSDAHALLLGGSLPIGGLNGRIADAVELSRDTLRRARHALGDQHPLTLSCQVAPAADLRAARASRRWPGSWRRTACSASPAPWAPSTPHHLRPPTESALRDFEAYSG
ncbi:hypothetical protein [Streptomyces sp. NPDC007905]|uniref:hypothetical protein n=1 Tax=Streptomyces sp. NPDC007905 TaxID=3364788 RepID=UPI0036E53470